MAVDAGSIEGKLVVDTGGASQQIQQFIATTQAGLTRLSTAAQEINFSGISRAGTAELKKLTDGFRDSQQFADQQRLRIADVGTALADAARRSFGAQAESLKSISDGASEFGKLGQAGAESFR